MTDGTNTTRRDLVLGIDSSTTACKAVVFDTRGNAIAEGRASIELNNPNADAWEQDAEQWWTALCAACRAIDPTLMRRVAAMCITQQRETFVVTDSAGTPIAPARVWMDHRGAAQVDRAVAALGSDRIHQLSGKPPCTTPTLYKLMDQLDGAGLEVGKVLDVHALLAWRLTGRCATSLASADPSGMIDMVGRCWAQELVALAGIDETHLPELCEPGQQIGTVLAAAAAATGLPADLPVIAGAGDGQCAGLGAGLTRPGRAYLNLGTAVVSGVLSADYRCDRAFRTLYGAAPGTYFLETDLHGGTFMITWWIDRMLREAVRGAPSFDELRAELEQRARTIPAGAEGLVVVPYWAGVMNPYWDDYASGIAIGWRGSTSAAHVYRAVLEGIALEQKLHTTGVVEAGGDIGELVVMGGGSKSDLWCQILADVLDRPLVRAGSSEATALGAAILATVAAGLHPSLPAACDAMTGLGQRFTAGSNRAFYQRLYDEVYAGLYPEIAQRMKRLAELRG